ncbi:unnamed protein product [Durusdinium trenchii]|uniref:Uncharacterized protein n=1 Tax=Durusdinium trenchii TaxID=1381693 RepID=A0ABP0PG54_9DINO
MSRRLKGSLPWLWAVLVFGAWRSHRAFTPSAITESKEDLCDEFTGDSVITRDWRRGPGVPPEQRWSFWPALPIAPYERRLTKRYEVLPGELWTFEQKQGILYIHVPIRMTVYRSSAKRREGAWRGHLWSVQRMTTRRGLLVYAPVAPTDECLSLLRELEVSKALSDAFNSEAKDLGWGGLLPWRFRKDWKKSFDALRGGGGGLFVAPILSELILNRYLSSDVWPFVEETASRWADMERIIPAHFDAPVSATAEEPTNETRERIGERPLRVPLASHLACPFRRSPSIHWIREKLRFFFRPPKQVFNSLRLANTRVCRPGQRGRRWPSRFEANYLSFATLTSSPNFLSRAEEFEACTGGSIVFAEAQNIWEDPIKDMGTKEQRGNDIYHAYFMSYSHFPEASALGLAESLEDRLAASNAELKWETTFPKVQQMGKYRTGSKSQLEFLMYDGDFFVPVIRLDLLERDQLPLPNTWREVLDLAHRYNGADLNEDGLPDFGMCHFPREGAGYFDWWWPELMYAIWATYAQVEDTSQGFLFDPKTLEPKLKGPAFQAAIDFMKEMWQDGSEGCISDSFSTGRCAIGFSPPGCWKGIFLNGVARRSSNGTVLWEPKMLDGSYAEPYRFKPFGTTQVEKDGILEECTPAMCPFAETIPLRGHHGNDDRARILPASPLAGKLINRAPFFWSGGLGIVIRKSAPKELKDML